MSKKYSYMSVNHERGKCCVVCGCPSGTRLLKHSYESFNQESSVVFACGEHREELLNINVIRMDSQMYYQIESGWENNPIWTCPVFLLEIEEVGHLHITADVGNPPTVFSGEVSGLFFKARGNLWPVEARSGVLVREDWENDKPQITEITIQEGVDLLKSSK